MIMDKVCPICRRVFRPRRRSAIYCKDACEVRARRLRAERGRLDARLSEIVRAKDPYLEQGIEPPKSMIRLWDGERRRLNARLDTIVPLIGSEWERFQYQYPRYRDLPPEQYAAERKRIERDKRWLGNKRNRAKVVALLRERDGDSCLLCGRSLDAGWQVDHVIPLSRGGKTHINNLCLMDGICNLLKADEAHPTFVERLRERRQRESEADIAHWEFCWRRLFPYD